MARKTSKDLDHICACINSMLTDGTRYDTYQAYGHTDIVFYRDPDSTGTTDVVCGLTKSEAYDVLSGIYFALRQLKYSPVKL